MSTAFADVVAGGSKAPGHFVPDGQVTVLPPVSSCLRINVAVYTLVLAGGLVNVNVVLPVNLRSKTFVVDRSNVVAPVVAVLAVLSSVYPLKVGAMI
jgi:hypothetical protein